MNRSFTRLFDPFAKTDTPPPAGLGPFLNWAIREAWPVVGVAGVLGLGVGLTEAFGAWLLGWIVDFALAEGQAGFFANNWPMLLSVAAFFLILRPGLMTLNAAVNNVALTPNTFPLALSRITRHTMGQSLRFFEDDFAGRLAQKAIQTSRAMTDILNEVVNSMTFAVSVVLGSLLVMGQVDGRLALVLAVWLGVYALLVSRFLPHIRKRSRARAGARAVVSGQLVDTMSNIATVKLFARVGQEETAAEDAMEVYRQRALSFGILSVTFRGCLMLLAGALPVLLIGGALWLWQAGQATAGDIATAGLLSTRIAQMSGWISFVAMGIFANLGEIEDGARTLSPPHTLTDKPGAIVPERATGALDFDHVAFGYGREGAALTDFNLSIQPGEKVALVGRSGAGKSTALSLLLRLYDVEDGAIRMDGTDIRDLTQDGLRSQIAMVRQETAMFNRSAHDNIAYGRPSASREDVIAAARLAQAHEFIEGLEDINGRSGYDAHLGERGVKLSGGQRQRIAIARAILADAPILLLDEATAALDSETEAAVQTALERLMEGRTVIAIAHRLSTISAMDRILVLDDGRIVEQGGHDDLLARRGLYAEFWSRQSGGFLRTEAAE
ncbi:ATP-binding cassette subfamily B protein [Rubricella aquisinus]|uniref:ATP-binding cassette subfamily B protein n=1 Tax=Rubricella aquisinus TaxID=2028108 RepID=A0A840WH91_9RHOB|nr:ABC transporter ATP-binding protein [Rubricella aquisinus]MBB5514488.1 ATP-binding cassette subfamily B protein [Rubricella aquisinus]